MGTCVPRSPSRGRGAHVAKQLMDGVRLISGVDEDMGVGVRPSPSLMINEGGSESLLVLQANSGSAHVQLSQ